MLTFIPLKLCVNMYGKVPHMLIRFFFWKALNWHMITMYRYLFFQKILEKIDFILPRNTEKICIFSIKLDFFRNEKTDNWEILDLYTTNGALSNVRLKFSPYSLLFFSIFFFKRYNKRGIHPCILFLNT